MKYKEWKPKRHDEMTQSDPNSENRTSARPFWGNLILSPVCYVMEGNVLVIDYNIQQQNTIW